MHKLYKSWKELGGDENYVAVVPDFSSKAEAEELAAGRNL